MHQNINFCLHLRVSRHRRRYQKTKEKEVDGDGSGDAGIILKGQRKGTEEKKSQDLDTETRGKITIESKKIDTEKKIQMMIRIVQAMMQVGKGEKSIVKKTKNEEKKGGRGRGQTQGLIEPVQELDVAPKK